MNTPTQRELATILAALRRWQVRNTPRTWKEMEEYETIAREYGPALDTEEIDALCERLNIREPAKDGLAHVQPFQIAIMVNGGVVEHVVTSHPAEVRVLDNDIEAVEEDEIVTIKDGKDELEVFFGEPSYEANPERAAYLLAAGKGGS